MKVVKERYTVNQGVRFKPSTFEKLQRLNEVLEIKSKNKTIEYLINKEFERMTEIIKTK